MAAVVAEVAASTKRAYESRVRNLTEHLSCAATDTAKIIAALKEDNKYSNCETRKGYLSALLWATKDTDAYAVYHSYFKEIKQECIERAKDQTLPAARQANYCSREESIVVFQQAQQLYLTEPSEQTLRELVIVGLYTIQPPVRADYAGMLFTTNKPTNRNVPTNYCFDLSGEFFQNDMMWFCFGRYKTFKTYGWRDVMVENDLARILRKWRDTYSPVWVLNMSENALTKQVMTVFKKHSGKATGIGLLRHAYIFDFYTGNPTLRQKELLAEKMLHSVAVQELYRTTEVVPEEDT